MKRHDVYLWYGDREYRGRLNPDLRGQRCRVLNTWRRKSPHNVQVEFESGERVVCPMRCLRKVTT